MNRILPCTTCGLFLLLLAMPESVQARSIVRAPMISYRIIYSKMAPPEYPAARIYVFRSGKILIHRGIPGETLRTFHISAVRAKELLDFIVRTQDFFSITQQQVKAFQDARGKVLDANTTVIDVWCAKGSHKVSVYHFPRENVTGFPAMARLQQIVRKLHQLRRELLGK